MLQNAFGGQKWAPILLPTADRSIPGKMNHSWDVPLDGEVVILVRRAGSADFHYVDK